MFPNILLGPGRMLQSSPFEVVSFPFGADGIQQCLGTGVDYAYCGYFHVQGYQ